MYNELIQTVKTTWNPVDKNSSRALKEWRENFLENEPTLKVSQIASGATLPHIPWISIDQNKGDYYITILFSAKEYKPFLAIQSKVEDSKTGKAYSSGEIAEKGKIGELIIKSQFGLVGDRINLNSKSLGTSGTRAKNYEKICPLAIDVSNMSEGEILSWINKFKVYVDFLNANKVKTLIDDNDELEEAEKLLNMGVTFVEIKQRVGQAKWKKELMKLRGTNCAICEIDIKELLIASHIKDWSKSDENEKGSMKNGLILCHNHDKIFDKKMITFDNEGKIMISDKLLDYIDDLNINASTTLKKNYFDGTKLLVDEFMEWHRNEFKK